MEKTGLKILLHASTFFAPILVPFILYLVIEDLEIKSLSIQALLFHLVMGALIFVSVILIIFLIGIPLLIGVSLMMVIVPIIGIVKAVQGEPYQYPLVGRWF